MPSKHPLAVDVPLAVTGSNSIEGYAASLDDVLAVEGGEEPLDASHETQLALGGCQEAMTYVLQLARDEPAEVVSEGLLTSLQFMMLKHDLSKNPGRFRGGPIFVRHEARGEVVYEGPPHGSVRPLVRRLLEELERDDAPVLVRAAMAHLNLMMIDPFSDGNGRMGRALQTLVLARDRIVAPVFSSIEETSAETRRRTTRSWLRSGRAPGTLRTTPARGWGSASPRTTARRGPCCEGSRRPSTCGSPAATSFSGTDLPERTIAALMDGAQGLRIRRAGYISSVLAGEAERIAPLTATRDLKALVDAGLLVPSGERRGRIYLGSEGLRGVWQGVRASRPPRPDEDPFDLSSSQMTLETAGG